MLALSTGWDDKAIGRLAAPFRAACHWALYVQAIVGPEGLADGGIPEGGSPKQRIEAMKRSVALAKIREALFPADV
jgi:hypothetical protein